jgi:hypothetical protein
MTTSDPINWAIIAYTFSVMAIAGFLIRKYALQFNDLKAKVHSIRICIEFIDASIEDDKVTKEEFIKIVKNCLKVFEDLFP